MEFALSKKKKVGSYASSQRTNFRFVYGFEPTLVSSEKRTREEKICHSFNLNKNRLSSYDISATQTT